MNKSILGRYSGLFHNEVLDIKKSVNKPLTKIEDEIIKHPLWKQIKANIKTSNKKVGGDLIG